MITYISLFFLSLAQSKECIYSYSAKSEQNNYTKQFSIDTDREEHADRIFVAEINYDMQMNKGEDISFEFTLNYEK